MPVGTPTDPAIKQDILDKIQNQGMSVQQLSKQYNIRPNVIYAWMRKESTCSQNSLLVELNKTKRELANAYKIIGELTAKNSTSRLKR